MNQKTTPLEIAASLTEFWSPKIISDINDSYVKVAKLKGSFVWHSHQYEDEMFMILRGMLKIEFRDGEVILNVGDIYVVPKGVEHNPIAEKECLVMVIEKKSTLHTGEASHELSRSIDEQLIQN